MSDNRPYPKILRTTEAADALLRAYAREYEIAPFEALVVAIDRLADPVESETLRAALDAAGKLANQLRAELESAREATRRADAETEQLRAQVAGLGKTVDAYSAKVASLKSELAGVRASYQARETEWRAGRVKLDPSEAAPCACALPADLAARVEARIKARPGRDFAFVVKNGCDRLEGSDRYVDKKKAERTGIDQ